MERVEVITSKSKSENDRAIYTTTHLCGQHTLEVCFLDCAVLRKESVKATSASVPVTAPIALEKKTIKSYCIVMVSEEDLQFVAIAKDDQVDIVRAFGKGVKYHIKLMSVTDISVMKGEDSDPPQKAPKQGTEPQPRSILIHLNNGSVCKIDTNGYGSTHLAKQIVSAWQSSLVLRSARLSKLNTMADTSMADEYLSETINSLKLNTNIHNNEKLQQKSEIFHEFTCEAWVDLQLKHAACRSREFFVSTIIFCKELLHSPPVQTPADRSTRMRNDSLDNANNSNNVNKSSMGSVRQSTSKNLFIDKIRGAESNSEIQIRLQATALQRLLLIRAALKAMTSVLFCSESSSSRYGLLGGPNPMSLDSWCSLLAPDLYVQICTSLGCAPETEEEQVSAAMRQSVQFLPKSSKNYQNMSNSNELSSIYDPRNQGSRSPAVSSLWRRSTGDMVSDSLLTPVKEKNRAKHSEMEEIAPTLSDTRRGVRDLQVILTLELARVAAIGYSSLCRNVVLSRNPQAPSAPFVILYFGEAYVRQPSWESSLEDLLVRVSTLLDDMLCSSAIKTGMREVSNSNMLVNKSKTRESRETREIREREIREREVRGRDSITSELSGDTRGSRERGRDSITSEISSKQLHRPRSDRSFSPTGRANRGSRPSGSIRSVPGDWATPIQTPTRGGMGTLFESPPALSISIPDRADMRGVGTGPGTGSVYGTPGRPPRTPISSSFEFGVDVISILSKKASVPPSPVPTSRGKNRKSGKDRQSGENGESGRSGLNGFMNSTSKFGGRGDGGRGIPETEVEKESENESNMSQSRCPLETQEILLFYTLSLLHTMALDSAQIRRVLGQDLSNYWLPIMQILNTICPRPLSHSHSNDYNSIGLSHSSNHPSNDNEESANANSYDNNRTSPQDQNQDPGSLNIPKNKKSFLGLFRSKNRDIPNTTVIPTPMEVHDYNGDTQSRNTKYTNKGSASDWSAKLTAKTDDMTHLLLSDYGPPLYGMSAASWTLLVISRRAAEELVIMLGLYEGEREEGVARTAVPFRLLDPTPLQIQSINRQNDEEEEMHLDSYLRGSGGGGGGGGRDRGSEKSYGETRERYSRDWNRDRNNGISEKYTNNKYDAGDHVNNTEHTYDRDDGNDIDRAYDKDKHGGDDMRRCSDELSTLALSCASPEEKEMDRIPPPSSQPSPSSSTSRPIDPRRDPVGDPVGDPVQVTKKGRKFFRRAQEDHLESTELDSSNVPKNVPDSLPPRILSESPRRNVSFTGKNGKTANFTEDTRRLSKENTRDYGFKSESSYK